MWQYTNETAMLEKLEKLENEKGEISMCQAIREIAEDSRKAGMQDGIQVGMQQGMQVGVQQGIQIFILDNQEEQIPKARIVMKLQRRFELSEEEANHYYEQYAK